MSRPIGMFRFQNTDGEMAGVELLDISVIEKSHTDSSASRITIKDGFPRYSSENPVVLMDRYDAMIRTANP